jgi:hypothetical protein
MDNQLFLEVCELELKYLKEVKASKGFLPVTYYDIRSLNTKKELLTEAIEKKVSILDLDYFIELNSSLLDDIIKDNIEESRRLK